MILDFQGKRPRVDETVFIAGNALVVGDVEIGAHTNIWFYSLLRGDTNAIRVGGDCNIQDGCILHTAKDRFPLTMEEKVVLGHRVTLHACHVGRGAMIGIGAIVLNGARVGEEAIVGAGSVVTPGSVIPPRTLALGTPARFIRDLSEKDLAEIERTRVTYRSLTNSYRENPLPLQR